MTLPTPTNRPARPSLGTAGALLIAGLASLLGGCSVARIGDLEAGPGASYSYLRNDKPQLPLTPTYCYRTLAESTCYDQSQEGFDTRLVNQYGPPRNSDARAWYVLGPYGQQIQTNAPPPAPPAR